jgi:phage replication-related protein YjqB (UPF0714/DUF867 family)
VRCGSGVADANRAISVTRAFPLTVSVIAATQTLDISNERRRREHMQIDPDMERQLVAAGISFARRKHLKLTTTISGQTRSGLYTVEQVCTMPTPTTVAISSAEGLTKLGTGGALPMTASLSLFAPDSPVDDAAAQAAGNYYETLSDNGTNTKFCVIAPHGGQIELYTDTMADALKTSFDTGSMATVTKWKGIGYTLGLGSQTGYDCWHITSVDMYQTQWPLLNSIYTRDFLYVLSLHGQSGTNRIDIGGHLSENTFIDSVVTALQARAELTGVTIVRTETEDIDGQSAYNIGNRLCTTSHHYVQMEMTLDVRNDLTRRTAIIAVLKAAYEAR